MNKESPKVFGYYGHNNAGDDAFKGFFDKAIGPDVSYLSEPHSTSENITRLIIGGGAVINDYFFGRLPRFDLLDVIGCSFPDGDDDVRHLRAVRDRLGLVALRSKRDAEVARDNEINAVDIPDLVFDLDIAAAPVGLEDVRSLGILPTISGINERTALLFLSDHYTPRKPTSPEALWSAERFKIELAAAIDMLSDSWNVVTIPMSVWYNANDHAFAADVIARTKCPEKVTAVDRYLGPEKILEIVNGAADLVVSMRYHGLVFGALCRKHIINIGDKRKNFDLMDEIGIPSQSLLPAVFDRFGFAELVEQKVDLLQVENYVADAKRRLIPIKTALRKKHRPQAIRDNTRSGE